jgi:hypothetical protein
VSIGELALRRKLFGESEVSKLHAATSIKKDVPWLYVTMQNWASALSIFSTVTLLEGKCDLGKNLPDKFFIQVVAAR